MEEDQEMKHACKLCNKSFPCGRSLGGHMRSHVVNSPELDYEKLHKKKLSSSLNNGGTNAFIDGGYGLRENPKKSSKFAESSEDTSLHYKVCKECGKGFQSWKALFGHMKCHSVKFSDSVDDEDEDSWTSANHKMDMDSESENEIGVPSRRKRSSRTSKRYIATTTNSSSFSINAKNASPSVSEIEQEDVAMCLMMLSRDVGLNSVGESSDNNSEFLQARTGLIITKIEGNNSISNDGDTVKFNKLGHGPKMNNSGRLLGKEKSKKFKGDEEFEFPAVKNLIFDQDQDMGSRKFNPSKRKSLHFFDPEVGALDTREMYDKKRKFQCTTCNKTFHSYQALGGHRASHKKLKGCFASKINGDKNTTTTDDQFSSNPTTDNYNDHQEIGVSSKKDKSHECPICFRVFSSGQALGGHKRSHLIGATVNEAKNKQSNLVIEKPMPETRDFIDLNMPAPVEEESSTTTTTNSGRVGFKPWWSERNHKHEPLLGVLSQ
ncbi:hypothetical protein LguiB_007950 [Lonicera macranthoides]